MRSLAAALAALHAQLHQPQPAAALADIQQQIRTLVPPVEPGGTPPQPKTPRGRTQILHLNYTPSRLDAPLDTEGMHLAFIAQTAQSLGIRLELLTQPQHQVDLERLLSPFAAAGLQYRITARPEQISKWAEDSIEFLTDGSLAILNRVDEALLQQAMTLGRRQRWQGHLAPVHLEAALTDDHLWIPLGVRVNTSETGLARTHVAQTHGQRVRPLRAYLEGGNLISGEDHSGRPVILVGKDAIATTAYLYQLPEPDVIQLICADFGLEDPAQLICVEQPGQFHLDMGLLFLGEGVVVLNDSGGACQDAIEMATHVPCLTTETLAAKLQLQTALETAAARDLEAAGLSVIRANLEHPQQYNFFNGEFVSSAEGGTAYITNGGPPAQQAGIYHPDASGLAGRGPSIIQPARRRPTEPARAGWHWLPPQRGQRLSWGIANQGYPPSKKNCLDRGKHLRSSNGWSYVTSSMLTIRLPARWMFCTVWDITS